MKKILIIGASGMIGNSLLTFFSIKNNHSIFATIRSYDSFKIPNFSCKYKLFENLDVEKKNFLSNEVKDYLMKLLYNY